jgi:SAM-dependent methyltransferase
VDPSSPSYAGQAVYTRRTLRTYDTVVVRLSNSLIWHCPARRILDHYDTHVTGRHLDIGPGTGYYLDRCRFPVADPSITLLDPNREVLEYAAARIARYRPATHAADALEPIELPAASFGSVGLSYVLHCMPGSISEKALVLDHVLPLLEPGGVVFGATIVSDPDRHNLAGRRLMRLYNRAGIFSNTGDEISALDRALAERFPRYAAEVVGAVALFAGWPGEGIDAP